MRPTGCSTLHDTCHFDPAHTGQCAGRVAAPFVIAGIVGRRECAGHTGKRDAYAEKKATGNHPPAKPADGYLMHSINVVRPNRRLQTCGDFHHYYSLEEPQMAASARAICASSYQIWSIRTQYAPRPNQRVAALRPYFESVLLAGPRADCAR